MRKVVGALAAVALLAAAGIANAETWRGMVEEVDEDAGTLTVEGMEFTVDEDAAAMLEGLGLGQDVVVDYEERDGENVATAIRLSE
jgi:hypothetical protein